MGHRRGGGKKRARRPRRTTPQEDAPYRLEELKALTDYLAISTPFELACTKAGIKPASAYDWRQRAEAAEDGKPIVGRPARPCDVRFLEACKEAEARDVITRLARITKAAQGGTVIQRRTVKRKDGSVVTEERYAEPQWAADMTVLERRFPEHFARRMAVQHGGEVAVLDYAAICREAYRRATEKRQARLVGASSTPAAAALPAAAPTDGHPGGPPS